jgi:hypothetical protein
VHPSISYELISMQIASCSRISCCENSRSRIRDEVEESQEKLERKKMDENLIWKVTSRVVAVWVFCVFLKSSKSTQFPYRTLFFRIDEKKSREKLEQFFFINWRWNEVEIIKKFEKCLPVRRKKEYLCKTVFLRWTIAICVLSSVVFNSVKKIREKSEFTTELKCLRM